MKKFLSIILCLTLMTTVTATAFAAEEPAQDETELPKEEILSLYTGEAAVPPAESEETTADEPVKINLENEEPPHKIRSEIPKTGGDGTDTNNEAYPETDIPAIEDIVDSEEFKDALENLGEAGGEIEDALENGDCEIIYITEKEFEQMRKDAALAVFPATFDFLKQSALMLLMVPATPFFIVIPFAGPFMLIVPIIAIPAAVASLAGVVASPAIAAYVYFNYELEPGYEIIN